MYYVFFSSYYPSKKVCQSACQKILAFLWLSKYEDNLVKMSANNYFSNGFMVFPVFISHCHLFHWPEEQEKQDELKQCFSSNMQALFLTKFWSL